MNKKKIISFAIIITVISLAISYYMITQDNTNKIHINVFGTEYSVGDNARSWLQLLDEDNQPIDNATCFITIYYPNNDIFINHTSANHMKDGIFYVDFTAPNMTGVYMVITECTVPKLSYTIEYQNITYDDFECGAYDCGYGWSDDWYVEGHASVVSSGNPHSGSYHLRLTSDDGWAERPVNNLNDVVNPILFFWAKTYSFENNEYSYALFWDGKWHTLKTWYNGEDDNVYKIYSFNLSSYNVGNNIIAFQSDMSGGADYFYIDDIKIQVGIKHYQYINETQYFVVRGSGEVHISQRISEQIGDEGANIIIVS